MDKQIATVQVAYEIIKSSKSPLTNPEIKEALVKAGRQASSTIIYPLLEKGYIKRTEKDGRAAYSVTSVTPVFGAPRKLRRKVAHKNKLAISAMVDSPAIIATPEDEAALLQNTMLSSYNALRGLQNTVATIKFATMLEERGPEQMILMLEGLSRMRR